MYYQHLSKKTSCKIRYIINIYYAIIYIIYVCIVWNYFCKIKKLTMQNFPGGAVVKNSPANAGDTGSIPGPGRSHMPRSN